MMHCRYPLLSLLVLGTVLTLASCDVRLGWDVACARG